MSHNHLIEHGGAEGRVAWALNKEGLLTYNAGRGICKAAARTVGQGSRYESEAAVY